MGLGWVFSIKKLDVPISTFLVHFCQQSRPGSVIFFAAPPSGNWNSRGQWSRERKSFESVQGASCFESTESMPPVFATWLHTECSISENLFCKMCPRHSKATYVSLTISYIPVARYVQRWTWFRRCPLWVKHLSHVHLIEYHSAPNILQFVVQSNRCPSNS